VSFWGDLFPSNTDSTDVAAFGKPIWFRCSEATACFSRSFGKGYWVKNSKIICRKVLS